MRMRASSILILSVIVISSVFLTGCEKKVYSQLSILEAKHSYIQGDHERAFKIAELLAVQGDADAQYALGYMLYNGVGGPENRKLGIAWIEQAAEKKNQSAVDALKRLNVSLNEN